jgi:trans-aconitate 2-methyltransferase
LAYNWDVEDYAKSSSEQQRWAQELIAKLHLGGSERILDIGCGDGKVTAELARLVPDSLVTGVDTSADMVAFARRSFPLSRHPKLAFVRADAERLCFNKGFDVVFSNATLHWVKGHSAVLSGIVRSLRPHGKALLQMGGRGNAADVVEIMERLISGPAWRDFFEGFQFPYYFYGPEEYREWLDGAGLAEQRLELIAKDMVHKGRDGFKAWIRTTWFPFTQQVPDGKRERFLDAFLDAYCVDHPEDSEGMVHVKMMRLEVEAVTRV